MQSEREPSEAVFENARVGYQAAVALWIYEGGQVWNRFGAMLIANSLLVGGSSFILSSEKSLLPWALSVPALGVLLCIVWWLLTTRSYAQQDYFVSSARELEELYLAEPVKTVARGRIYSVRGEQGYRSVTIRLGGDLEERRIPRMGRVPVRRLAHLTIAIMALLHFGVAVLLIGSEG